MKNNPIPRNSKKGFTLIELLVVIAILALLMSIIIITLNPAEILRKTRDTKRIADLSSLRGALNLFVTEVADPGLGTTGVCYVSLPSPCANTCGTGPTCVTSANLRLITGSGWLPVNFGAIAGGSPLSALPVDPTNATSTGGWFYYSYTADNTLKTFELNANMESAFFRSATTGVVATDGGNNPAIYEVGSDPGLDLASSSAMFGSATSTTFYAAP